MRRIAPYSVDLGLLFVILVWGFSPTVFKIAFEELDPLAFVFVRFVLLSVVAIAVLAWRGARGGSAWRIRWRDLPLLIISGLAGYGIYQLFYMVGLAHTAVFDSALLISTVPLWTLIVLRAFRVERVTPLQWAGVLISLAGVVVFLLAGHTRPSEFPLGRPLTPTDFLFGDSLTLVAAGLFAVYGIVNRPLGARYSPPELMCYTLLVGTLALAPFGAPAAWRQDWSHVSWYIWLIIPYTVIFPIYVTYSIWNWAITQRGPAYVSMYTYVVPVIAGIVSYFTLGEVLTTGQWAGGAVIFVGMLAARFATRAGRASASPSQTS